MNYPYETNNLSQITRVFTSMIPQHLQTSNMTNFLFPDVISGSTAYHHGCSQDEWNNEIQDLLIFCLDHGYTHLVLFWTENDYKIFPLQGMDWKNLYPRPSNWNPISVYNIGIHAGITKSLKYTLEMLPPVIPYQVFISNPQAWAIPRITTENSTCKYIIDSKGMTVFAHMPYLYNLANAGLGPKIREYLTLATALGIKGCIIHCGKNTKGNLEESFRNMEQNILEGMAPGLCPLVLETPAGQKNEMLSNYYDFIEFTRRIYTVHPTFSICIDSCHVFASNYCPYQYLKYCVTLGVPVSLIHYNDSLKNWNSNVDRHANIGEGHIPWVSLEKMAFLANAYRIPMVLEY